MRFGCGLSTSPDLERACREAADEGRAALEGAPVDVCFLFVAAAYPERERAPALVSRHLDPGMLVGCSGGGIIGGGMEVEGRPAVSVTVAHLPGVDLKVLHVATADLPSPDQAPSAWVEMMQTPPQEAAAFILLPEPFTFSADRLIAGLDFAYPEVPKIGGLASGSNYAGGHDLYVNGQTLHSGAALLTLSGGISVETRVAQGCRPFGKAGRITRAENNNLLTIEKKPAIEFLQEQLETLGEEDRELVRRMPLFLGIAMNPFPSQAPGPGDWLIRNILGFDPGSGVLSIGEILSAGRLVQFHLRDRKSSSDELREVLGNSLPHRPGGALLFSCLGRGKNLYGEEGHDSGVFEEIIGQVPLAGFFCNGEIGPVHGTTHLHGYTSSFGLFREARA